MTKCKQRPHGANPAGWQWRASGPVWAPSPGLRAAGWKGGKLTAADGSRLSRGASIDAACAINTQVQAWREGRPVAPELARFAPNGATGGATGGAAQATGAGRARGKPDVFSIGALVDAWLASEEFARRKPLTQVDYRHKLKRLVDTLAGYPQPPRKLPPRPRNPPEAVRAAADAAWAAYEAAVAETRADPIWILQPTETAGGMADPLHAAYHLLLTRIGVHQASGVFAVARVWLGWCHKRKSRRIVNWAADVERVTPGGRIRVLSAAELAALVKAAEAKGLPSIADSILLGVDLSWSQADRLNLTWDRVREGVCYTGAKGRQKTGNVGATPLLALGLRRLGVVRERQRTMAAQPTHVIWCERTGRPWTADAYRRAFAEIRALAALEQPSVADGRDQDLRDTAVTWALNAGLKPPQIASRTLQKLSSVVQLITNHYGEIGPEIAEQGRAQLDAYLAEKGVAL